jgi:hypothetical protein
MTSTIESEINENISLESNETSTDQQTNDSNNENTNTDESSSTTTTRTPGQTAIGAKLVKKLETLGLLSNKIYPQLKFHSF